MILPDALNALRAHTLQPAILFAACLFASRFLTERISSRIIYGATIPFVIFAAFGPLLLTHGHLSSSPMTGIPAAFVHGQPMYPSRDSAQQYGMMYSPATFLVYLPPQLISSDLRSYVVWLLLPELIIVSVIWRFSRIPRSLAGRALVLINGMAVLIPFANFQWSPRADIWILCGCAIGLLAALSEDRIRSILVMALAGAFLLDLKITTVLVAAIPPITYWGRTKDWKGAFTSYGLTFPLSLLVFLLPRVSLRNFADSILVSSRHGIVPFSAYINLLIAIYLFLPPTFLISALLFRTKQKALELLKSRRIMIAAYITIVASTTILGAKRGSGGWHLAPLIPLACLCSARIVRYLESGNRESDVSSYVPRVFLGASLALIILSLKAVYYTLSMYHMASPPQTSTLAAEMRQVMRMYPGKDIEIGYGSSDSMELANQRTLLIAGGSHLSFDTETVSDLRLSNISLPPASMQYITSCAADAWLIPREQTPFTTLYAYYKSGSGESPLAFPSTFRNAFTESYTKSGHTTYFDIYVCRKQRSRL